ncbi:MAG: hypothetical protein GF331_14250 [Chitinivibrionales bacterium]|nr:hypothetical protein [Chitinivibrionales bacterium]
MADTRITTVEHNGKVVLISDFSDLFGSELLTCMRRAWERDKRAPDNSLLLTDISNCKVNKEVRDLAVEMGESIKGRGWRQAIVGVTGLQKVIFSLVKRDVYLADSRQDALEYLTRA